MILNLVGYLLTSSGFTLFVGSNLDRFSKMIGISPEVSNISRLIFKLNRFICN